MASSIRKINFQYDGLALSPLESTERLGEILQREHYDADSYSLGGVVEVLEQKMAGILEKERAIFMPSGTLANHLALKALVGSSRRVIVQEKSHIYNDSGDCMQQLSGINLIPLKNQEKPEAAGYTLAQVKSVLNVSSAGKVKTDVGVISIESPVRRLNGMVFPREDILHIVDYAKEIGVRTHLDGARLFIAAAYAGMSPSEYAAPFDTVYVSLYKYFNAPFGAILAGSRDIIDGMYHQRRMFGGGLNEVWSSAAPALDALDGFMERYSTVVKMTAELKNALDSMPGLKVENMRNGTNVFRLKLDDSIEAGALKKELLIQGIQFPGPETGFNGFYLKTNESLLREPVESVVLKIKIAVDNSRSL
ncbi:MAG: hypothetical protein DRP60_10560 [Spirochaetes bacterium]|nr:MAG: hypothetical protein DRP60_10560 [Spirochaetota bacterium]